jgi:hypothetical protein
MDASGRVYRRCKCGEDVYVEVCPSCGETDSALADLADAFQADRSEDLEKRLLENHQRLQRTARPMSKGRR